MEFSSFPFLFLFLPAFLALFLLPGRKARPLLLLIASLFFYVWGEGGYVLVLLISIVVNQILGSRVEKAGSKARRKALFVAAIAFNLGLLAVFKYASFLLSGFTVLPGANSVHSPLGISFFTFQALSYLADIYRKTAADCRPFRFALYMAFFPKLANGPITPFREFSRQMDAPEMAPGSLGAGIQRIIIGLGKKVLVADTMARIADPIFALPAGHQTLALAWLGISAYALQIYFDFSGYSDMAIGLGRLCGFRLPENFNYPYSATSIKEFWRRWHISLGLWLRDYLFLPIAYAVLRRIKPERLLRVKAEDWSYSIGTFVTFLICGIWHGANWTFLAWGLFYGVLLVCEHAGLGRIMKRRPQPIRLLYTQFLVIIAWAIFRSPSLAYAGSFLKALFGLGQGNGGLYYPALYLDAERIFFAAVGIAFSFPLIPIARRRLESWHEKLAASGSRLGQRIVGSAWAIGANLYLIAVLLISVIWRIGGAYNPFIYFRF